MMTKSTTMDDRNQTNLVAKTNGKVRLSAPDRTAPALAAAPRPAVDDEDAWWVTQRMFDHYNG